MGPVAHVRPREDGGWELHGLDSHLRGEAPPAGALAQFPRVTMERIVG